jgi:hypothetical protein
MEINKKKIMELIAILVYIVICVLVVNVFDHKPSKPSNPEHVPIPNTGELVSKHFSWIKPGLSKTMNLNTVVQVRTMPTNMPGMNFLIPHHPKPAYVLMQSFLIFPNLKFCMRISVPAIMN